MAYYKSPSEMMKKRSEKNKKHADSEYKHYKNAKESGDKKAAKEHYVKSQRAYNQAKDHKEQAKKHEGKTFKDLRKNKK